VTSRDPFITRALAIAALAGLFGIGHSMVVPVRVSVEMPAPMPQTDAPAEAPPAGEPDPTPVAIVAELPPGYLDLEGGYAQWEQGAWFLDARNADEFDAGHIEGAFLMPSKRVFTAEGQEDLASIQLDDTIVIYCVGGDCDASENTMLRLLDMDYQNILIMKAGYEDWLNAGYPVSMEPAP
jgi:rhodanese-related sulfurtransferase